MRNPLLLLTLSATLIGCATQAPVVTRTCQEMTQITLPASAMSLPTRGAVVTEAVAVGAQDAGNTNGGYCRLRGAIKPVDPQAPEIRFQVNIPSEWNGRAVQYGGGGYNGSVPNTLTWPTLGWRNLPTPLKQGYITFASDSGHQAPNGDDASFALNDESLLNYGYMHIKKTRDAMVALTQALRGSAPKRVYFQGGSTGGREALTAAMRWPEAYDGVVTIYPTANFMGIRLWGAALARAIYDSEGGVASAGWIPPAMVTRIVNLSMQRCDGLDGATDGLVSNIAACRAQSAVLINELACKNGETGHPPSCLTAAQIRRTIAVYHEGITIPYSFANGVNQYGGYNSLEGITMQIGSQPGYLEPPVSGPNAHHVSRADQFFKFFVARDPKFNLLSMDIQNPGSFKDRIIQLSEILGATQPDWSTYAARGGKVLFVQGNDDPSVSPFANIAVYNSIVKAMGQARVDNFMRLYLVPGLAHGGGRFTPELDTIGALDQWVDRGIALKDLVTYDGTNSPTKGRSRPLCEYPTWAKYRGSGDVNLAASFECVR
jgi:pimeloyl-ACP methyl ester carboxylesterase